MQGDIAPASSFVRIRKPGKRGCDRSRLHQSVVDASATGMSLSGLERGRADPDARGVAVVRHAGKPVGTVEVGLDVGAAFLEALATRSGNHYEFYPDLEVGTETFGAADQGDYRLGATFEGGPLLTGEELREVMRAPAVDRDSTLDGIAYAMRALAIHDHSGDIAGVATVLHPTDASGAIAGSIGTAEAAILLGTGIATVTGSRLGRQCTVICLATQRLAAGDLDLEISGTERRDEIGRINRALKQFHEKLRDKAPLDTALGNEEEAKRAQKAREQVRAAERAEEQRIAREAEARRERELSEAMALAAEAEQAAAGARMREQQQGINLLATGLEALADGDLCSETTETLPGGSETLRHDFNAALGRPFETMRNLHKTADRIDGEVAAIAQAPQELSHRTEHKAATLEETAAALDALTASVQSAADSASEAGRGFAVVAPEGRGLVQRSSKAAREICDLIAASETEISRGVGLVGRTGQALDRILDSVRDLTAQVIQISNSSQEQASGLSEINTAVNMLDTATHQNAAMFEETSAAAAVLNDKTRDLLTAIRQFRFAGGKYCGLQAGMRPMEGAADNAVA